MKIENISIVSIPNKKGELTEIRTDNEFINQDKEWFWEQFFVDENGEVVAKFVQKSSEDYSGLATQLSHFRQDIFIVNKQLTEQSYNKRPCDIVKITNGKPIVINSYDYIEEGEEDCTFLVRKDDLIGFIDIDGNEIIKPQYLNANEFYNGTTVAKNTEQKYGLINKKNDVLIPFIYNESDVNGMLDGYCVFKICDENSKVCKSVIYNSDYKIVLEHNGDIKNLAYGNFAVETSNGYYEIRKLN